VVLDGRGSHDELRVGKLDWSEMAVVLGPRVVEVGEVTAVVDDALGVGVREPDARERRVLERRPPVRDATKLERVGGQSRITGASFWTDAAVLGFAGIPSILFGPGGAGLHSTEEYVNVADVVTCRDALVEVAKQWMGQMG
jgi:di/tripeptidase